MPRYDIGKLIAALVTIERGHNFLRYYVPAYEKTTKALVHKVKRKLGLKKTIWDEVVTYLQSEEVLFACASPKACYIAEEFEVHRRILLPSEVNSVRLQNLSSIRDTFSMVDIGSTDSADIYIEDVHPYYAMGTGIQQDDPEGRQDDPVWPELFKARKMLGGWKDLVFLSKGDMRVMCCRLSIDRKGTSELSGAMMSERSDAGSDAPSQMSSDSESKLLFLFRPADADEVEKITDRFLSTLNPHMGCITSISKTSGSQNIVTNAVPTKTVRLRKVAVDLNVYPDNVKSAVEQDIVPFIDRRLFAADEFDARRSYLFVGPPGCGKTRLVGSILSKLPLSMTVLTLQRDTIWTLSDLYSRYPNIKPLALVIEDIDLILDQRNERQILMNFLDGLFSWNKMITIMTANNPKVLGRAFLRRPGRIDHIVEIRPGTLDVRTRQIAKILADRPCEMTAAEIAALTEEFSFAQQREVISRSALYSASDSLIEKQAIENAAKECREQFFATIVTDDSYDDPIHDSPQIEMTSLPVGWGVGSRDNWGIDWGISDKLKQKMSSILGYSDTENDGNEDGKY